VSDTPQCPICGSESLQKRGLTKSEEPKQQYSCNVCNRWFLVSLVEIAASPEFFLNKARVSDLEKKNRYFVTCSQNNTPVDFRFWASVKHYVKKNDSTLVVLPIRYRNPTSIFNKQDQDVWWPDEVQPYLVENILKIHPDLWIMGNMRIQATAENPLLGLDSMSQGASAIYGHNQIQMKTVPTPQNLLPKICNRQRLWTEGKKATNGQQGGSS